MSEQLKVALVRAVIGAGAAFFSYLVLRGGIEGTIDAQAAKAVQPIP